MEDQYPQTRRGRSALDWYTAVMGLVGWFYVFHLIRKSGAHWGFVAAWGVTIAIYLVGFWMWMKPYDVIRRWMTKRGR